MLASDKTLVPAKPDHVTFFARLHEYDQWEYYCKLHTDLRVLRDGKRGVNWLLEVDTLTRLLAEGYIGTRCRQENFYVYSFA